MSLQTLAEKDRGGWQAALLQGEQHAGAGHVDGEEEQRRQADPAESR